MITALKKHIDLLSVVESAGVKMRRAGSRHIGLCPFHQEKTPSFFVFPDNRFMCFGCGEHGDVIDFVRKLHGLSFRDALRHLGIEEGRITPEVTRNIERRKRKAELVRQFKEWRSSYIGYLGHMINKTQKLMQNIPPKDLNLYAPLLHGLPTWEYHLGILTEGSDRQKYQIYKNEGHKCRKNLIYQKNSKKTI